MSAWVSAYQLINDPHLRPAQSEVADSSCMNLAQMWQIMQRPQCQPISAANCVIWSKHHPHSSKPNTARNQLASLEKCSAFQTRQSSIYTFVDLKTIPEITLKYIAWNWFYLFMNNIKDMASLKEIHKYIQLLGTRNNAHTGIAWNSITTNML